MAKFSGATDNKTSIKRGLHEHIQQLSCDYDLMFFFHSDCVDAQDLAAVILEFERIYKWRVWAISIDGRGLPQFPDPLTAKDIPQNFNLKIHPAVIAINRFTHHWVSLAYGPATVENLERQVADLLGWGGRSPNG